MRDRRYRLAVISCRLALLAGIVALWETASRRGWIDRLAWSRPSAVWPRLRTSIRSDTFLLDLRVTSLSLLGGFVAGALLGFVVGVVIWRTPAVQRSAEYALMALQAIPFMIFYPLLLAVFGLTRTPVIILVAAGVMIPVAVHVSLGLQSVSPNLVKLARSLRSSPLTTFWKVRLPAAVPLIYPGVELGFIYAVVGTIGMEFILATKGLGFRVGASYRQFQPDQMYADIVLACLFAVVASSAVKLLGRLVKGLD